MPKLTALIALSLLTLPAAALAALANDEVTSQKLKEADNTGSQDTNSGSGVKTNHLQNKAVTAGKIADGAVGTTQLATGAVTDAKIAGPISTSKLSVGTAAGTVAAGNHTHDGVYQKRYGNVAVVALSGGDYASPIAALAAITNASEANPWLVKLMPGVYDLGGEALQMKPYVDIEGSGESTTKIVSSTSGLAALFGASNAELRFLSVVYVGAGSTRVAIRNDNVSPKISHVTAITATGGNGPIANTNSTAVFTDVTVISRGAAAGFGNFGIQNVGGAPVFTNVTIAVSDAEFNYGIMNHDSASVFRDLTVTAAGPGYGIFVSGGTPSFDGATVSATNAAILSGGAMTRVNNGKLSAQFAVQSNAANGSVLLSNTMLDGAMSGGPGGYRCISVYDGNLNAVTCP